MAYVMTVWEDQPGSTTPINATRLNKIEQGIKDAHDLLGAVTGSVLYALPPVTKIHGDTFTLDASDTVSLHLKDYLIGSGTVQVAVSGAPGVAGGRNLISVHLIEATASDNADLVLTLVTGIGQFLNADIFTIPKGETHRFVFEYVNGEYPTFDREASGTGSGTGTVALTPESVKTAYESNDDTNAFTDAEKTKLGNIENNATADQTAGEIKTAYESNADTNAFTDSEKNKLFNIEANATGDQTASEIKALYESNTDTNAFTDTDKAKLDSLSTNISDSFDAPSTLNTSAVGSTSIDLTQQSQPRDYIDIFFNSNAAVFDIILTGALPTDKGLTFKVHATLNNGNTAGTLRFRQSGADIVAPVTISDSAKDYEFYIEAVPQGITVKEISDLGDLAYKDTVALADIAGLDNPAERDTANIFSGANTFSLPVIIPDATASNHAVAYGQLGYLAFAAGVGPGDFRGMAFGNYISDPYFEEGGYSWQTVADSTIITDTTSPVGDQVLQCTRTSGTDIVKQANFNGSTNYTPVKNGEMFYAGAWVNLSSDFANNTANALSLRFVCPRAVTGGNYTPQILQVPKTNLDGNWYWYENYFTLSANANDINKGRIDLAVWTQTAGTVKVTGLVVHPVHNKIPANTIATSMVLDNAITASKLPDDVILARHISNEAVTYIASQLGDVASLDLITQAYMGADAVAYANLTADIKSKLDFFKFGDGDPNGVVTGYVGQRYFDALSDNEWRKSTGDNTNTGWTPVNITVEVPPPATTLGGQAPASISRTTYPEWEMPSGVTIVSVTNWTELKTAIEGADTEIGISLQNTITCPAGTTSAERIQPPDNAGTMKKRWIISNGFYIQGGTDAQFNAAIPASWAGLSTNFMRFNGSGGWLIAGASVDEPMLLKNFHIPSNSNSGVFQLETSNVTKNPIYLANIELKNSNCSFGQQFQTGNTDVRVFDCVAFNFNPNNLVQDTNNPDFWNCNTNNSTTPPSSCKLIRCVGNMRRCDDGYDFFGGEDSEVIDCVVFHAGVGGSGDGVGIKAGGARAGRDIKLDGCLVVGSKATGVDWNTGMTNYTGDSSSGDTGVTMTRCTVGTGNSGAGWPYDLELKTIAHVVDKVISINTTGAAHEVSINTTTVTNSNFSSSPAGIYTPQFYNPAIGDYSLVTGSTGAGLAGATDVAILLCMKHIGKLA